MVHDKEKGWDITERNLDRNRGFRPDTFNEVLKRVAEKRVQSLSPPDESDEPKKNSE